MTRLRCLVVLLGMVLSVAAVSQGAVFVSVSFGPPALPVYVQPPIPAPGYIWVPGYWAWDPNFGDYYWVPGTWVLPPQMGYLWTPGYWGFSSGAYNWHPGYWGATVGFYGGINYGFGYPGNGYYGGQWRGREFYYNRAVNNVHINNVRVYNQTVNNVTVNRVAYNGGPGGVQARPTNAQLNAEHGRHVQATQVQMNNEHVARNDRSQFANANHGRPAVVATPKPGALNSPNAVRANLPETHRPNNNNNNVTANARPVPRPPQTENQPQQRTEQNQQHGRQATNKVPAESAHNVPRPPQHEHQAAPQQKAQPPQQSARQVETQHGNSQRAQVSHSNGNANRSAERPPEQHVTHAAPPAHGQSAQQPRQAAAHESHGGQLHGESHPH